MKELQFTALVCIYRSERQYHEAIRRKEAAKKTLTLLKAFGGPNIPFDGFSCDIDKTIEDLEVFQILQKLIEK